MVFRRHPRWHRNSLAIFQLRFSSFQSISPLECAVTRFRLLTPLECAVTKTRSRKSFRMRSSEKRWGGPSPLRISLGVYPDFVGAPLRYLAIGGVTTHAKIRTSFNPCPQVEKTCN